MTVKILKYNHIVLSLFEKVDDFINVYIKKRGAAGRVEIAPFRTSTLSMLTRRSNTPVWCSFFSTRNKAVKRNIPAPLALPSTGKARETDSTLAAWKASCRCNQGKEKVGR
jgi:hypothetical protein